MLKAFVLVSLLGVSGDDEISSAEKADAVKMAHLRTFSANAILIPSYQDTEKGLKKYFHAGSQIFSFDAHFQHTRRVDNTDS